MRKAPARTYPRRRPVLPCAWVMAGCPGLGISIISIIVCTSVRIMRETIVRFDRLRQRILHIVLETKHACDRRRGNESVPRCENRPEKNSDLRRFGSPYQIRTGDLRLEREARGLPRRVPERLSPAQGSCMGLHGTSGYRPKSPQKSPMQIPCIQNGFPQVKPMESIPLDMLGEHPQLKNGDGK